ncbi:MAG: ribonuclease M5 [Ureaplasma sp.]|nr:ribonuclease M5 [Ureaplasma sp.]
MQNKQKIRQTIVVEGKSDLDKIKSLFNVDVITTNGSDINKEKLNLIKKINENNGVILFLDPDYAGEKIRKIITNELKTVKQCFIAPEDMIEGSKKIGIAEASNEAIINALNKVIEFDKCKSSLSLNEYNSLRIDNKNKRINICKSLNISYCNNKQLFKRLNMMGIKKSQLESILIDNENF